MSDEQPADGDQQDQEQAPPKNILKAEQIVSGLTQVSKTYDAASYAFTQLNIDEKELEELGEGLRMYHHLRQISMQKNQIKDISEIIYLPHLLTVNAAGNQVASIEFLTGARDSL